MKNTSLKKKGGEEDRPWAVTRDSLHHQQRPATTNLIKNKEEKPRGANRKGQRGGQPGVAESAHQKSRVEKNQNGGGIRSKSCHSKERGGERARGWGSPQHKKSGFWQESCPMGPGTRRPAGRKNKHQGTDLGNCKCCFRKGERDGMATHSLP